MSKWIESVARGTHYASPPPPPPSDGRKEGPSDARSTPKQTDFQLSSPTATEASPFRITHSRCASEGWPTDEAVFRCRSQTTTTGHQRLYTVALLRCGTTNCRIFVLKTAYPLGIVCVRIGKRRIEAEGILKSQAVVYAGN